MTSAAESPPASHVARPLTGAYRPIRRVSPPETPYAGLLAADGDAHVVLVDVAELDGAPLWAYAGRQHVLGPVDVARREDGHDAVLPWCTDRVDALIARRTETGRLPGGELVTLAVSVLRGVAEAWHGLRGDADGPEGTWWLTSEGKPVFVAHAGGTAVEAAARGVLEDAAEGCTDRVIRRLVAQACEALERPRALERSLAEYEERLFEACAPRRIEPPASAPAAEPGSEPGGDQATRARAGRVSRAARRERALRQSGTERGIARRDRAGRGRSRSAGEPDPVAGGRRTRRADRSRSLPRRLLDDALRRHGDGRIADAVGEAIDRVSQVARGVRRRLGGSRRAPLWAGAAVAAAVLIVGLSWPEGDPPAEADQSATSGAPGEAPGQPDGHGGSAVEGTGAVAEEPAGGTGAVSAEEDPVLAAEALLSGLDACRAAADAACTDVRDGAGEVPGDGAVLLPPEERVLRLVDDYGGVAVVGVGSRDEAASEQFLVLVRESDRWLIREGYAASAGHAAGPG